MFDRILIGVDGSDCARRAATFGFELADACDASVDVLLAAGGGSRFGGGTEDETETGQDVLDETAALATDMDVVVDTHLVEGRPATVLTEFATDSGADLVVLGRRGRSGLGKRLLGSVTERVLRRSDVPVLAVADAEATGDAEATYEDVLVTTDGSDAAEWAGPYAAEVARRCDARLHLLNAVDVQGEAGVFDAGGVSSRFVERLEQQGEEALDRLADTVDDVDHRTAVVRDAPHEAVRTYVEDNDVDLVVMASRGQSGLAGQRLGSVTGRILRTVEVPVLVVTSAP